MNISYVNVGLSGDDLLSIFNEFIDIKELDIKSITIDDEILIEGTFNKFAVIKFQCGVRIKAIENNIIEAEVSRFKVLNIKIAKFIRKLALKFALKSLKDKGIIYKDGKVSVNYKYLLKDVPYIDLDICKLFMANDKINVEVKNIKVSLGGELKKEVALFEEKAQETINDNIEINKVKDKYTIGREIVANKLPNKVKSITDYIFIIPDIVILIYRLLKDKRVSIKTKVIISGAVAYISVPSDILPDKIPFVGKIDDLAVAVFALDIVLKEVPLNIILENWQGKNVFIVVLKSIIEYATNFTGAKNVETIYKVVDEVVSI